MNQNENTPSMYARKIETLEKLQAAVADLIARYGRTLGILPGNNDLVAALDRELSPTTKIVVGHMARIQMPDILDVSWSRQFIDSNGYAVRVVKSLANNRTPQPISLNFIQPRSFTQELISRFAAYQRAYGIPPDFATIVKHVAVNESLSKNDPNVHNFNDHIKSHTPQFTQSDKRYQEFNEIVKSSVCESMEFKRHGNSGLPVWDTIANSDIILFLSNLTQRQLCWKWIAETSMLQSNEFRQIAGEFSSVVLFDYCGIGGVTRTDINRCLGFGHSDGYIDFVTMSFRDFGYYGDGAMWHEMAGHIASLHIFLVTIRAQIELAEEKLTLPKTFNEAQPQPVEKQVPPVPHSFTIPVQPPVYRRKVASAPVSKELNPDAAAQQRSIQAFQTLFSPTGPSPVKVTKRKTTKQVPQEPKK